MSKTQSVIGQSVDWPSVEREMDLGNIRRRRHPDHPNLWIYNYTEQVQFSGDWTPAALMCRGLIANGHDVIARPFPKFFNLSELPDGFVDFNAAHFCFEKMDGCLGIAYEFDGKVAIASRGSFDSPQALWATAWLKKNYPDWRPSLGDTYVFEIVAKQFRVVLDYGDFEGLVFLDKLSTKTGRSLGVSTFLGDMPDMTFRTLYNYDYDPATHKEVDDQEGLVLYWPSTDQRVKIKYSDYLQRHRIFTGTSEKSIWEAMGDGTFDKVIADAPDEIYDWIREVSDRLNAEFAAEYGRLQALHSKSPWLAGRKDYAKWVMDNAGPDRKYMFLMYDGQCIDDLIWKSLRPVGQTYFSAGMNQKETA